MLFREVFLNTDIVLRFYALQKFAGSDFSFPLRNVWKKCNVCSTMQYKQYSVQGLFLYFLVLLPPVQKQPSLLHACVCIQHAENSVCF